MSFQDIPTLQQLAIQGLASNEDAAVSALKDLPKVFFPLLFKNAFIKRHVKLVKHMVANWPYPNLYIGPLMDYYHVDTFQAVLDGVDWLSSQKVRPKRCRLKELNLVDVNCDFLEIWTPTRDLLRVPPTQSEEEEEEDHTTEMVQPISVHADYVFLYPILK
ncbi:oogenesin-2-like [Mus caroli]|uniref:Oogenesin-2-like n=1 Tax=Mus caroli TaxID=10089 RepID=A0A6P5PGS1_MUSCR|nr:oogenesin-2-like [Mus caroli]